MELEPQVQLIASFPLGDFGADVLVLVEVANRLVCVEFLCMLRRGGSLVLMLF